MFILYIIFIMLLQTNQIQPNLSFLIIIWIFSYPAFDGSLPANEAVSWFEMIHSSKNNG
jgi:hypothetical protein